MPKTLLERPVETARPDLGIAATAELDGRSPADALREPRPGRSLRHALMAGEHPGHGAPAPSPLPTGAPARTADRRVTPDGRGFRSGARRAGITYGMPGGPGHATLAGRLRGEDTLAHGRPVVPSGTPSGAAPVCRPPAPPPAPSSTPPA